MFYKQGRNTFIRIFEDFGYIINKATLQDYVTDPSGAVFLKSLSRNSRELNEIIFEIAQSFVDADITNIQQDTVDFYRILEENGFIVSGKTVKELEQKDMHFSYKNLIGNAIKNDASLALPPINETQSYLDNYLKANPLIMAFQIEITSRCNEQCIHCYIPHEGKMTDIAPSLYYDILEQCRNLNLLNITLSGGEALLHPEFCNFLRKAKEYDFSVSILSNLTLLNDSMISAMKEGPLCNIQVSLYSLDPLIHDSITRLPGSFEKTKASILRLVENNIPVQISCPTVKQNKNCFKDVMNWAHENKCRAQTDFIIMAQTNHNTDNLVNRLSLDETRDVINDILENDIVYQQWLLSSEFENFEKNYVEHKNDAERLVCGVCTSTLCTDAKGNVYPCAGWQDYHLGNVNNTSLKDIWENSPKVKYLRSLRRKYFPQCLTCADKGFCTLCMARNANEDPNGNFFNINKHFCEVAAINRKIALDWRAKHLQND